MQSHPLRLYLQEEAWKQKAAAAAAAAGVAPTTSEPSTRASPRSKAKPAAGAGRGKTNSTKSPITKATHKRHQKPEHHQQALTPPVPESPPSTYRWRYQHHLQDSYSNGNSHSQSQGPSPPAVAGEMGYSHGGDANSGRR